MGTCYPLLCYYPGCKTVNGYLWKRGRNVYVPAGHSTAEHTEG